MSSVGSEWDFYLQAFRLHQGLSRVGNEEERQLLRSAVAESLDNGSRFGRAFGLLSFTIQNSWLCNWIDYDQANVILKDAIQDIGSVTSQFGLSSDALDTVSKADTSGIDTIIKAVILGYAQAAYSLDDMDYDNMWSLATATLYSNPSGDAVDRYKQLRGLAQTLPMPAVTRGSIDVDYADALFFAGDPSKSDQDAIIEAINVAEAAVAADISDKKRQRWHWTLGWAYYELSHFTDRIGNCEAALKHLETFKWPHDLIRKNLIAAYVGAGRMIDANRNAVEFIANNDGYTVAVEERWPYRDDSRRKKWQKDLSDGGLG